MKRFEGKVALVTGAGSGIGRATAVRLAAEGARIFACDIDASGLADLATEAKSTGAILDTHILDVSDPEACSEAVGLAVEAAGKIDVLCNIAGIWMIGHLTDFSPEQWNRLVGVNLSGVFFMSQAAVPHLLETEGNIVNMSSSAGLVGQAYNSMYCATKAGVRYKHPAQGFRYGGQSRRQARSRNAV